MKFFSQTKYKQIKKEPRLFYYMFSIKDEISLNSYKNHVGYFYQNFLQTSYLTINSTPPRYKCSLNLDEIKKENRLTKSKK